MTDDVTDRPCPGGGKNWTVDIQGRPICPRCRRALSTVAGKGRTVQSTPKVPRHERPGRRKQPNEPR
ncbi:hypothetical protein [Mycolicibacterium sediminis]|uniref:Uncharacterized protein n=1 Tax=Mycolicibacterium sediminis TaxID=1286180 RepID=A0A7I7QY57_9MYCO|nr:hypothetical protein [Mycolicibacterium sediminis]BBY31258.1 hypothetical protein MSEDJ_53540 [Mycolicibacterium sediminis]